MTHKTIYNFDQLHDCRNSDSGKWSRYDEDVIPMWVADMDLHDTRTHIVRDERTHRSWHLWVWHTTVDVA